MWVIYLPTYEMFELVWRNTVKNKTKPNKYFLLTHPILIVLILILLISCLPVSPGPRIDYTYRFSIKNETNSDLDVKLNVGEIPNVQAGFDELTLVSDELFKLNNELWSNEYKARCIIKPNNNAVVSFLPIDDLGTPLDTYSEEYIEKQTMLRENLLNKFFSFVLTISRNGEIIYRIVGWDVPDEDMEKYKIDDKLLGYYHTALENYEGSYSYYPLFFSKLLDENKKNFGGAFTFYIKTTSNKSFLQEFIIDSIWVDEDKYWREH